MVIYKCRKCKFETTNICHYKTHMKQNTCSKSNMSNKKVEFFKCVKCNKIFDRKYNYDRHLKLIHDKQSNIDQFKSLSLEEMFEDTKKMMVECIKLCNEQSIISKKIISIEIANLSNDEFFDLFAKN